MQSPKLETYLSGRAFQFQLKSLEEYYKRFKIAFGEEGKTYQLHEYRDLVLLSAISQHLEWHRVHRRCLTSVG